MKYCLKKYILNCFYHDKMVYFTSNNETSNVFINLSQLAKIKVKPRLHSQCIYCRVAIEDALVSGFWITKCMLQLLRGKMKHTKPN